MNDTLTPVIISAVVGIGGLLLGLIGASIRATWKIAEIRNEMIQHVAAEGAHATREYGETLAAVRQHVSESNIEVAAKFADIQLWNRDNFTRKEDFMAVIGGVNRAIDTLSSKLDQGIQGLRMEMRDGYREIEEKLDKLQAK